MGLGETTNFIYPIDIDKGVMLGVRISQYTQPTMQKDSLLEGEGILLQASLSAILEKVKGMYVYYSNTTNTRLYEYCDTVHNISHMHSHQTLLLYSYLLIVLTS